MMRKIALFLLLLFTTFSAVNAAKAKEDYETLALSGSSEEIKTAFATSRDLAAKSFGTNKESFLMLVLKNNRAIDVIRVCINGESDVMAKAKDGRTPLMYAAEFTTDKDIIDLIVKSGALSKSARKVRVLAKDKKKRTAFDYAVLNSTPGIYTALLSYADDPNPANKDKRMVETTFAGESSEEQETSSEVAVIENAEAATVVAEGEVPVVTIEMERESNQENPEPSASEEIAETPAEEPEVPLTPQQEEIKMYTTSFIYDDLKPEEPVEEPKKTYIIENPNKKDKNGVTLLMKAAKTGNDWDVRALLENGADVNARDKDGWTALMYAARYQNNLNIIDMLIEKGAYVRVRNKYNATPLLMASDYSQNPEIIKALLKNRSNSEDEVFRAFIFVITGNSASDHIREAKIKLFLDMELPVNRIWQDYTPLMYAAQYCSSTGVIKQLLDSGAKPEMQDAKGKTAFDYALENKKLPHDDTFWALNSVSR